MLRGKSTSARPQPKGPLTLLGQLLDVVVWQRQDDIRIRPRRKTDLLWRAMPRPRLSTAGWLVWTMGQSYKLRSGEPTGQAARVYERWSVWEADRIGNATLTVADEYEIFTPATFGYRSDKFSRKQQDYEHSFGPNVRLYRPRSENGVWVIKGGKLRLTAHGIEG